MLRLVNVPDDPPQHPLTGVTPPTSVDLSPPPAIPATDPRWVLAVRAVGSLEGGRAAILRPDQRARLLRSARDLGLRPFDASLVIAIVQDAARRGLPLRPHVQQQLALVGLGPAPIERPLPVGVLVASVALGVILLHGLIRWLTG